MILATTHNKQQQKQQAKAKATTKATATAAATGGPQLDISGTPIAQGPKLRAKGPLPRATYLDPPSFGSKLTKGQGQWAKMS